MVKAKCLSSIVDVLFIPYVHGKSEMFVFIVDVLFIP